MVLTSDGQIMDVSVPPPEIAGAHAQAGDDAGDSSLWGYEKAMIIKALQNNNWNQTRAAKELGISRDNLRYRVKKYEIKKPQR